MNGPRPTVVLDPVCGMTVEVAAAEADGRTTTYRGRTYAFCRAGCLRAFLDEPATYADHESAPDHGQPGAHAHGDGSAPATARSTLLVIDAGMRRWYESCSCCLSDAYPEVKAALDAERAAAAQPQADPGICDVAEGSADAATAVGPA